MDVNGEIRKNEQSSLPLAKRTFFAVSRDDQMFPFRKLLERWVGTTQLPATAGTPFAANWANLPGIPPTDVVSYSGMLPSIGRKSRKTCLDLWEPRRQRGFFIHRAVLLC
jgi:hypothetical protein